MHLNNVLRYLVILLTVLVIAISVLPVSATPSAISGNAEPKKSLQVTENAEREYFNLSSFRGAEQPSPFRMRNLIQYTNIASLILTGVLRAFL
ncbi:MAG: hypothetical protein ACXAEL_09905 [Candidatus Hodarchaeales archaeon]